MQWSILKGDCVKSQISRCAVAIVSMKGSQTVGYSGQYIFHDPREDKTFFEISRQFFPITTLFGETCVEVPCFFLKMLSNVDRKASNND